MQFMTMQEKQILALFLFARAKDLKRSAVPPISSSPLHICINGNVKNGSV